MEREGRQEQWSPLINKTSQKLFLDYLILGSKTTVKLIKIRKQAV